MRLRLVPVCVCLCAALAYGQEPKKEETPQGPAGRGASQRGAPSRFSRGSAGAQPDRTPFGRGFQAARPQWEYAVRTSADLGDLEAGLNKLGQEGWELVSVTATAPRATYVFKRARDASPFAAFGGMRLPTPFSGGESGSTAASSTSGESRGGGRAAQAAPAKEDFVVINLKNASATALARTLQQLFGQPLGRGGVPRFASDDRSNALIVAGSQEVLDVVRALVQRLDEAPERDERIERKK